MIQSEQRSKGVEAGRNDPPTHRRSNNFDPYASPPTQVEGVITNAAGNAARDSGTFATETTQIRDVTNDILVLETPATPFVTTLLSVGKVFDGKTWGPEKALMKEVTISQTF